MDIDSDYNVGMPEVRIVPNRANASKHSVSITTIGNTINGLVGGVRVGSYTHKTRRYDIRVQMVSDNMNQVERLEQDMGEERQG